MRSNSRALTIDEVRARFEEWRKNRQGKSPIPDELWSAAAQLARKDGINRTAAELHLDGGKLKRLMVPVAPIRREKTTPGKQAPAFVELLTPRAISIPECTIELEGRHGTVRIQLKGACASDLASLSRSLWEAAS
jgi:hypothetical protein